MSWTFPLKQKVIESSSRWTRAAAAWSLSYVVEPFYNSALHACSHTVRVLRCQLWRSRVLYHSSTFRRPPQSYQRFFVRCILFLPHIVTSCQAIHFNMIDVCVTSQSVAQHCTAVACMTLSRLTLRCVPLRGDDSGSCAAAAAADADVTMTFTRWTLHAYALQPCRLCTPCATVHYCLSSVGYVKILQKYYRGCLVASRDFVFPGLIL